MLKLAGRYAEEDLGNQGAAGMERRELLADGLRYLARMLPAMVSSQRPPKVIDGPAFLIFRASKSRQGTDSYA